MVALAQFWPFLPSLCDFSPNVAVFALALRFWPFWPSICDFSPEVAVLALILALACPETIWALACMTVCVCVCVFLVQ